MSILRLWIIAFILVNSAHSAFAKDTYVNGYYRKNGTYVQPHYRSAPDGDVSNNWSTRGNVNPYTGQMGTRNYGSTGLDFSGGSGSGLGSYSQPSFAPYLGGYSQPVGSGLGNYSTSSGSSLGNYSGSTSSPFSGSEYRVPLRSSGLGAINASSPGESPAGVDSGVGGDAGDRMIIAGRLMKLGLNVDWQKHSLAQLQDLEARVGVSRRLQQIGEDVPWQHKTLPQLLDIQARIEASKRLQSAGKSVDWKTLSLGELLNLEGPGVK